MAEAAPESGAHRSTAYARLLELIHAGVAVILDGAVATEIERTHSGTGEGQTADHSLWGTWALYNNPYAVLDVHRRYVETGCDVISTDTWAILGASEREAGALGSTTHWMDVARTGIRLARQAVDEAGRIGECAVAFSLSGGRRLEREARVARAACAGAGGRSAGPVAAGDHVAGPGGAYVRGR